MIVRTVGEFHYLIPQPQHARQSGVIAAHLSPGFLGCHAMLHELLLAVVHHDDGWVEWEADPIFGRDHLPLNFDDINKERHIDNWTRGVFSLLHRLGPYAASLLARHALPLIEDKGGDVVEYFHGLLAALEKRAWPSLEAPRARQRTDQGFHALAFADLISLIGCAGWEDSFHVPLHDDAGREVSHSLRLAGPWTVAVDPWPFLTPRLDKVRCACHRVPVGREATCREVLGGGQPLDGEILLNVVPASEP